MKKIVLIILLLSLLCAGTASAYYLNLSCPDSLQAGLTLKCSVDSTLPAGTSFNLVFYQSMYTATPLDSLPVTIQENHATQYKLFDTRGLKGGQYKVEIQGIDESRLSSDSFSSRLVKLIDRSDEITLTSPTTQNLADALQIAGSIAKKGNEGVEIEVRGQNVGTVYYPQYIPTTNDIRSGAGVFNRKVTVTRPDDYDVYFRDSNGLIGIETFTVIAPAPTQVPTTVSTTVVRTTKPPIMPTPSPTPTKSPMGEIVLIGALGITGILIARVPKKP
jgi:hypothetical protein